MKRLLVGCVVLLLGGVSPLTAWADSKAHDVEVFIDEYVTLWNAGDAASIVRQIYSFDTPNPLGTEAGLQAAFARLKTDGYSHSVILGNHACLLSAGLALAELRYSRIRQDGQPIPPKARATLYVVRKKPEGWRIVQMLPMNFGAQLNCSSYTD